MAIGIQLFIAFVIGGLLGLLIGRLMGRNRAGAPDNRLEEELRQQVTHKEGEMSRLRDQFTQASNTAAAAAAQKAAAEQLLSEQKHIHEQALREARQAQEKALVDLREAFKALSADALKQSAPEFLRLAEQSFGKLQETAKGDLAQRQEAIKTLVEPLKVQLETYQKRLQQSETAQSGTLGEVRKQLESLAQQSQSLASETQQFRMVLNSNQARGRWGEETLRRVVEAAGMSAHCDFDVQVREGESKPDLVVKLPGERMIIVDAKVPDLDFLNASDTGDAVKRSESLVAHAAKLRATIKSLADRDYPRQFPNALDHVVLFVPAESLFSAALEGDPDLIVWAERNSIYLATPASLIAVLRTINYVWQQHAQSENAQKIADAAKELFSRICIFTDHFGRIGDGLARANEAFNKATASYQSRVRPAGDKLAELGGTPHEKILADVPTLDTTLRLPDGNS